MRINIPAVLALILVAAFAACGESTAPAASAESPVQAPAQTPIVIFPDGHRVNVVLATDPESQARGLMFVARLPDDQGMLFLFNDNSIRSFWMKNCEMAIDMIWLDGANKIVDITDSAPPCQSDPCPEYKPKAPCRNVLEVRGGLAREHSLHPGDTLIVVNANG